MVAGGVKLYVDEGVEQRKLVDIKRKHPGYDSGTINNDICLVKVRPIFFLLVCSLTRPSRTFNILANRELEN